MLKNGERYFKNRVIFKYFWSFFNIMLEIVNPLSANPTKWSNTPKQLVGKSRLTILWGWCLKR